VAILLNALHITFTAAVKSLHT